MRACTVCGQGNLFDKEKFCSKCGNKTEEIPACICGFDLFVPLEDKYCPVCGIKRKKITFEIAREEAEKKQSEENSKYWYQAIKYIFAATIGLIIMLLIVLIFKLRF